MGQTVRTHVDVAIFPFAGIIWFYLMGSAFKNMLHTLQLLPIKLIRRTEILQCIVLVFLWEQPIRLELNAIRTE